VPVELIREYYGDEIAIYYAWLNFFLKQIMVPACLSIVLKVTNELYFEDPAHSPLNAFFSIFMAFWAGLFAVNWKRK